MANIQNVRSTVEDLLKRILITLKKINKQS